MALVLVEGNVRPITFEGEQIYANLHGDVLTISTTDFRELFGRSHPRDIQIFYFHGEVVTRRVLSTLDKENSVIVLLEGTTRYLGR